MFCRASCVFPLAIALICPLAEGAPPSRGRSFRGVIRALDRNRDGQVSAAEISRHAVEAIKQLDANKDGRLTQDEVRPRRPRFGGRRGPGKRTAPPLEAQDAREKKILAVLREIRRNQAIGMMNVPERDGRLLRLLAESINAQHVVEIGTSNGYSGIWLCLALTKTNGRLTTYEIDRHRASLAKKNFKRAGVDRLVTIVLGDAHRKVKKLKKRKKPIDLLFLDADKDGYVDYLEQLLPQVRKGGLIVAHNIAMPRKGITEYLKALASHRSLETLLLHMDGPGVSVTLKKR